MTESQILDQIKSLTVDYAAWLRVAQAPDAPDDIAVQAQIALLDIQMQIDRLYARLD